MKCIDLFSMIPPILFGVLLLMGCDSTIDSLTDDRLAIRESTPADGQVGQPYTFRMTAEVKNNSNDDAFDYRFTLADGTLPPGTRFVTNRELGNDYAEVTGTPSEAGTYTFAVAARSIILEDQQIQERAGDVTDLTPIRADDEELFTITIR